MSLNNYKITNEPYKNINPPLQSIANRFFKDKNIISLKNRNMISLNNNCRITNETYKNTNLLL